MASTSGTGQSGISSSNIVSGSVGSPGSANGPVRVGMNPHNQERRTGDVSSAFADMPQAVSKVNFYYFPPSSMYILIVLLISGY